MLISLLNVCMAKPNCVYNFVSVSILYMAADIFNQMDDCTSS